MSRYSATKLIIRYIHYFLTAKNGKGHGMHSPFVFDFITRVLNDKEERPCYDSIESLRKELLSTDKEIEVVDFGAGSGVLKTKKRRIKDIASSSLKPRKYAQLLHRIVQHYKPVTLVELGTSLGITSLYLASGNPAGKLITFEGDPSISSIAKQQAQRIGQPNIQFQLGEFEQSLSPFLSQFTEKIDLAYIDGNHRKEPTLRYFHQLLQHIHEDTILIFDDIHWSEEMEGVWNEIHKSEIVTLSIDLFFIGIVFFKKDFKEKQHFQIRF